MTVVNVRYARLLIAMTMAACAARAGGPATVAAAPPASREALAAKPMVWAKRDTSVPLLPTSIGRLQIVITPGWAAGEHYAWLVSNGSDVIRVYRCASTEIGDIVDTAIKTIYPTVGSPLDKISFGVVGSIHAPPPPPPDPGGFPGDYVQQVMRTAWGMNRQQAQIDAVAVP
jgi:hypothetical protein